MQEHTDVKNPAKDETANGAAMALFNFPKNLLSRSNASTVLFCRLVLEETAPCRRGYRSFPEPESGISSADLPPVCRRPLQRCALGKILRGSGMARMGFSPTRDSRQGIILVVCLFALWESVVSPHPKSLLLYPQAGSCVAISTRRGASEESVSNFDLSALASNEVHAAGSLMDRRRQSGMTL